jgi:hypothetical protein
MAFDFPLKVSLPFFIGVLRGVCSIGGGVTADPCCGLEKSFF